MRYTDAPDWGVKIDRSVEERRETRISVALGLVFFIPSAAGILYLYCR